MIAADIRAFIARPPYQQRVIVEKVELDARIGNLFSFLDTEMFNELPSAERKRLVTQHGLMVRYSGVLGERIGAFK